MTRTDIYNMEIALYGAEFPRPAYNLQVRGYSLVDEEYNYVKKNADMFQYLNAQDVIREVATGDINGSNRVFTTTERFIPGSLQIIFNGQFLKADQFTEDATTYKGATLEFAPEGGDVPDWILFIYTKQKQV